VKEEAMARFGPQRHEKQTKQTKQTTTLCYSNGATECDDFQIAVLIKCVEYKKHEKLRKKIAKCHLILTLYFLKIKYLNRSPCQNKHSCNRE
jgi:hypothetical protein